MKVNRGFVLNVLIGFMALLVFCQRTDSQTAAQVVGDDSRVFVLGTGLDALTQQNFRIPALANAGGGVLHFRWRTGGNPPVNCVDDIHNAGILSVVPITSVGQVAIQNSDVPFLAQGFVPCNVSTGSSENFLLKVPHSYPNLALQVFYVPGASTISGTFDLTYIVRADGYEEPVVSTQFPPLVDTVAQVNSLSCFMVGGFGVRTHTVELQVTGSPATCSFQLEGANGDGQNFLLSPHQWFNLSGAVDCTVVANRLFHVVDKPVMCVRPRLTVLTGGASPTVRVWYMGIR
ncbi:MAG: hypothetical protein L0099_00965 [Acidobacteria bacterium]|nr:hypothetical protein [Acidobacteriota bacterium]